MRRRLRSTGLLDAIIGIATVTGICAAMLSHINEMTLALLGLAR